MKKKKIRWAKALPIYIMMLPGVLYFIVNNYLPMAGIVIAFKKINYRKGILEARGTDLTISSSCSSRAAS